MNFLVGHYVTIYMIHRPQPTAPMKDSLQDCLMTALIMREKAVLSLPLLMS
jgi:hypothetical protein